MGSKTVNTGTSGSLQLNVTETSTNSAANTSVVSWNLRLIERVATSGVWNNTGTGASVNINGTTVFSGDFDFDWRPSGLQNTVIASGTRTIAHDANGSKTIAVSGHMGSTGTGSAGGPTDVGFSLALATLVVVPGVPTAVTATRISDTQTQLGWAQSSASNGQPTTNTIQESNDSGVTWADLTTINDALSAVVGTDPNTKSRYRVRGNNSAGSSAYSVASADIYTTPSAPTNVTAAKDAALNINIAFTSNVGYPAYNHEVWHGTVAAGVTTWDGAALATLPAGTFAYQHVTPNPAQVHIYRVRATQGVLASAYGTSAAVQLLAAPNKPTISAMAAFADKASALVTNWVHNSVDTSPQSAYEFSYSTNGGTTWTTTGKVASTAGTKTLAANTFVANNAVTIRVRTWGAATTGGSDGTGASPFSDLTTVTMKTIPVATVTSPANGAVVTTSSLKVNLGFAQAEAATFVQGEIKVIQGGVTLEDSLTNTLIGTQMATVLANAGTYTVSARVRDSNGLWSAWVSNTFTVTYLTPVTPGVTLSYVTSSGFGQIDVTLAAPGAGESAATTVTITRAINGGIPETIVDSYPAAAALSFFDTTANINGTNTYAVTATSALGATKTVTGDLVTNEQRRAFLSKGAGFNTVTVFGGNLSVSESLSVASNTVEAAGRTKPIGLYGIQTNVQLKVDSLVYSGFGSSVDELRSILLLPGKACYRDSSGRRVFGTVSGSVAYKKVDRADLSFTVTETS